MNIVQVLGIIVAFGSDLTPEVIEDVLGLGEEVMLALRGLSAFVGDENEKYSIVGNDNSNVGKDNSNVGNDNSNVGSVSLIHASFRDFLVDSSRSDPFHVIRAGLLHGASP